MIIELQLTPQQQGVVQPLVSQVSSNRKNAIFIATAAPNNAVWRFQMTTISGATATKILRLLKTEDQQRETARTAC
jgi:hypothetical protein